MSLSTHLPLDDFLQMINPEAALQAYQHLMFKMSMNDPEDDVLTSVWDELLNSESETWSRKIWAAHNGKVLVKDEKRHIESARHMRVA